MKKTSIKLVLYSAFINAVIMLCYILFCSFKIELPDNLTYAQFILEGDYTFDYMDFFICAGIGIIQKVIYPINAFVIVQFLLSYFSFCSITVVFIDKFKYIVGTLVSMITLSFFAISHYGNLSFTRDAGVFCVAGFLLIIHFMKKKKYLIAVVPGGLLIFAGAQYRFLVFLVSAFIAVLYVLVDFLISNHSISPKIIIATAIKNNLNRRSIIILLTVIVFSFSMHYTSVAINTSTPELAYYREYTYARQSVYDYPIPDYSECSAEYDAINFNQNDIDMNRAWYLDDGGAFTLENLKILKSIRDDYFSSNQDYVKLFTTMVTAELENARGLGDKGIALLGGSVIAVLFFILIKKRYYVIPAVMGVAIMCFYFYLWNTNREPPYRAVYMLWLSFFVYTLYSFRNDRLKEIWKKDQIFRVIKSILMIVMIGFSITGFYLSGISNSGTSTYSRYDHSVFFIQKDLESERQTCEFVNTYYKYSNTMRHMAEFGTDNLYSNLLNTNVYFVCDSNEDESEMMRLYLTKYYGNGKTIECQKTATITREESLKEYMSQHEKDKFELSRKVSSEYAGNCVVYKYGYFGRQYIG